MARPRVRPLISVRCANCDKELLRSQKKVKRYFCDQSCFFQWLREKRPASEIRYRHERGGLLAELQRVANELGHLPTYDEMRQHGKIYPSVYSKRFGAWQFAIANITDPSPRDNWSLDKISEQEGGWLAGVTDSETTFRLSKATTDYAFCPIWGLQLRADDLPMIQEMKRILGLSYRPIEFWHRDNDRKRGINAGDAVRFYVRDTPTLIERIIPVFERFRLHSKKAKEFDLFAEAVRLLYEHRKTAIKKYPPSLSKRLTEIKLELERLKKYVPPNE